MSQNAYLNKKSKRNENSKGEKGNIKKKKLINREENKKEKFKDNFIIGIIKVEDNILNQSIINPSFYEQVERISFDFIGKNNEKQIKDCEIYINDKRNYYNFPDKGYYKIKYVFKNLLNSTHYMFYNCDSLISLDLSNFNTQKVTEMSFMFSGCKSLISLDLSNFNTQKVNDMSYMFSGCNSLISLDLSSFNTQNVTTMYYMFSGCNSLISLDLTTFNTHKVNDMAFMFTNCDSLVSIDLSNFNTQNVKNIYFMFYNCRSLISLDLSNFNIQQIDNFGNIFVGCNSLIALDLHITNLIKINSSAFYDCSSLVFKIKQCHS